MPIPILKDTVIDTDTGKVISADEARAKIKSALAAGETSVIQRVIENNLFKRKIHKVAEVDTDAHKITFIVSADNVDRDGERVLPKSLSKDFGYYQDNPVVLWNHDHSLPAIAKMVDHKITDTQVIMTDQFAVDVDYPRAKVLWELYANGYMQMTSLGFIPLKVSDDAEQKLEGQTGVTFERIEVIEHSYVNVGANRSANRYAISQLPEKLRNDTTLKSAYEELVEQPIYPQAFTDNKTAIQIPSQFGETPIVLNISIPEKEVTPDMEEKHRCPKCEESEKKSEDGEHEEVVRKGVNLAAALNAAIGDGDDRADKIDMMASAAGVAAGTVNQILDGDIDCPPMDRLEGFAEALGVSVDGLMSAAEEDGCTYGDDDDDMEEDGNLGDDDDADKSVSDAESTFKSKVAKKMYGMVPGTYEHRQNLIRRGLYDYLEENVEMEDTDDEYYYMDFEVIGTTDKDVVVYCWNTSEHYKADYTLTDNKATFSNLMPVMPNVTYTPMEMPADEA